MFKVDVFAFFITEAFTFEENCEAVALNFVVAVKATVILMNAFIKY